MNIVFASDNNFVQHCTVALLSVMEHNKDVDFYILTDGLSDDNITYITDLVEARMSRIHFCYVPTDIVKFFPMSSLASSHIGIATYYRLFITSLLPKSVAKAIYLDCDMIVRGPLDDLWNIDLTGNALAAVYQHFGWSDHNDCWERLNIPRNYGYFNAGCLLMNIDYLRDYDLQKHSVDFINTYMKRIISHDQDVLNALLYDKTIALNCKWNFLSHFLSKNLKPQDYPSKCNYVKEITDKGFSPIIVHFVSKPKPWHYGCKNPYTSEYYHYLGFTKWNGFKPKFILKQYIDFVVITSLKLFFKKIDILGISEKRHLRIVRRSYMDC